MTDDQVAALRRLSQAEAAQPLRFNLVASGDRPVITCFGLEAGNPRLAKARWLHGNREEFGRVPGGIWLGSRAADFLRAKPGDRIEVGHEEFTVAGIFQTENGFEDGCVFLPLKDAQTFFSREGISSIVAIKLRDGTQGAAFKAEVESAHPKLMALENREFNQSYTQFNILNLTAWAVGLCAFLLGGLGVANTMLLRCSVVSVRLPCWDWWSGLLHLLGGLDLPDRGEIAVCGLDPRREEHRLQLRRKHLGFVFQLDNLIPDLTVAENLRVPALADNRPVAETTGRLHELAEAVGIAHRLEHRIQGISGGERQRTAICRALMNSPRLLLADEPTGSLDEKTGDTVFALLRSLVKKSGITVVLATHERRFAEQCDRLLRVRQGRIEPA